MGALVGSAVRGGGSGTSFPTTNPQAPTAQNIRAIVLAYNRSSTKPNISIPGFTRVAEGSARTSTLVWVGTEVWMQVSQGGEAAPTITSDLSSTSLSWISLEVTDVAPVLPSFVALNTDSANVTVPISRTATVDDEFELAVIGGRGGSSGIQAPTWPDGLTAGITSLSQRNAYDFFATGTLAHSGDTLSGNITISNSQGDRINVSGIVPLAPLTRFVGWGVPI